MSYVTTNVKMFLSALMVFSLPGFTVAGGFDQERMPSDIAGKMLYRHERLERSHDEQMRMLSAHYNLVNDSPEFTSNKHVAKEILSSSSPIIAPHRLGQIIILHDNDGFHVLQNGKRHDVNSCWVDGEIRNRSNEELIAFVRAGGYISVNQMDDGEFSLRSDGRLLGGGAGGATVGMYAGKGIVEVLGHGTIAFISSLTGPAAAGTALGLELTFGGQIEILSNVAAVAGAIMGGVFTGPI